jgi:hypothetical protein
MKFGIIVLLTFWGFYSQADISDVVRRRDAVALYEFKDMSGGIVRDTSNVSPALDLTIGRPNYISTFTSAEGLSGLNFYLGGINANQIYSNSPATKIINACKASKEMTVEVWLENGPTVKIKAGNFPDKVKQPQRIVSLTSGINNSNFTFGEFYDGTEGEQYLFGVRNSGQRADKNGSYASVLSNAVSTKQGEIIVPSEEIKPNGKKMQKIVFTLSGNGQLARLYLSDRRSDISNMYLSQSTQAGFNGPAATYFNNWNNDARLVLGNEFFQIGNNSFSTEPSAKCMGKDDIANPANNCANPNRYWAGKLYLVAIYCRALAPEEIYEPSLYQIVESPALPVDINTEVTPELQRASALYQRLAGVSTPISDPLLKEVSQRLVQNDPIGAARLITDQPSFYNITVRDFAARMSNRDETINTPLNDFTASVIGVVRDETNAKALLTEDLVYVGSKAAVPSDEVNDMIKSNVHYQALDAGRFDLSKVLERTTQKVYDANSKTAAAIPEAAGLLTTRQWASAHAIAGTQRRMVEFTFREFLCTPIDRAADKDGPENVVGADIDQNPGGSHEKFLTTCKSCHTIMDAFRPAFSKFTFNNNMILHVDKVPHVMSQEDEDKGMGVWTSSEPGAGSVVGKFNKNKSVTTIKTSSGDVTLGRLTTSDNWENNANLGSNKSTFKWTSNSGKGIKSFGKLISESAQFPKCMAQRVFKSVCKRDVSIYEDELIKAAATEFATTRNFNLKYLFQRIATSKECLGDQ